MTPPFGDIKAFISQDVVRPKLLAVSTYLAVFEICKTTLIDRPRTFFSDGFDENGVIVGEEYQKEVLSLHNNKLQASLLFMKRMEVIDDNDISFFYKARSHRNKIAHETITFLLGSSNQVDEDILSKLIQLVEKVEKWWIINFEIPISPEFDSLDPNEIDYEGIIPGQMIAISLLIDMAFGDNLAQQKYRDAFKKLTKTWDNNS